MAGLLAWGLTSLRDPTSGFMALRKDILDHVSLEPSGWKIALEIVVGARPRVVEIPVIFTNRRKGRSKLSPRIMAGFLRQLRRLHRDGRAVR